MSWRRLQHFLSVTIFRLPRRLEDISQDVLQDEKLLRWRRLEDFLKTYLEGVLKACLEYVLKTCLANIFKMSWRQKKWGYLYLTNLNVCVSNKSIFHKSISDESKVNPKLLIRTQWFQYSSILKFKQHFYFEN